MFPKEWKFWAVAPLTIALITTVGCGDRKRDASVGRNSQFTGLWLRAEAKHDYDVAKQEGPAFNQVLCGRVQANPDLHGLPPRGSTWDGELRIEGWRVTSGGDVYEWSPALDIRSADSRDSYYVGHVSEEGFFSKDATTATSRVNGGYGPNSFMMPRSNEMRTARIQLSGPSLLYVYRGRRGGDRAFAKVNEAQMQEYALAVTTCARASYNIAQSRRWASPAPNDFGAGGGASPGPGALQQPQRPLPPMTRAPAPPFGYGPVQGSEGEEVVR